jgi:hypothetical protein
MVTRIAKKAAEIWPIWPLCFSLFLLFFSFSFDMFYFYNYVILFEFVTWNGCRYDNGGIGIISLVQFKSSASNKRSANPRLRSRPSLPAYAYAWHHHRRGAQCGLPVLAYHCSHHHPLHGSVKITDILLLLCSHL